MSVQEELNSQELGVDNIEKSTGMSEGQVECEVEEVETTAAASEAMVNYNDFTEGQLVEEAKSLMKITRSVMADMNISVLSQWKRYLSFL